MYEHLIERLNALHGSHLNEGQTNVLCDAIAIVEAEQEKAYEAEAMYLLEDEHAHLAMLEAEELAIYGELAEQAFYDRDLH